MPDALLSLETPVVIAHRGGAGLRPENTMAAFENAVRLGADAVECDVHLSKDDEVVVIHDDTVDRTTDGRGKVSSFTADELSRLDAGASFRDPDGRSWSQQGIGVPRLEQVLLALPSTPLVIELKGADPRIAAPVLDVIRRAGREPDVVIGGFSHAVLTEFRRLATSIPTSASTAEVRSTLRRAWFRLSPRQSGCRLYQLPPRYHGRRILRPSLARLLRGAGFPIHAWVVDEPEQMRMLLSWGVTGLISDRPDLARDVIDGRCLSSGRLQKVE
jgi:glycerophosphoryl diester phosphodiesterase